MPYLIRLQNQADHGLVIRGRRGGGIILHDWFDRLEEIVSSFKEVQIKKFWTLVKTS